MIKKGVMFGILIGLLLVNLLVVVNAAIPISNCQELQNMQNDLDANYELVNNIGCYGFDFGDGKGFRPIGTYNQGYDVCFEGSFDGKGFEINYLSINRPNEDYVGLFGCAGNNGIIKNVKLRNMGVSGNNYVGCLAGKNYKDITNIDILLCGVNGIDYVGGITGHNNGDISKSSIGTFIWGRDYVGGITGINEGKVAESFSSYGSIITGNSYVGGLVGKNLRGTIIDSYSSKSTVKINKDNYYDYKKVDGGWSVGGLVGQNLGTIERCYSTNDVRGTNSRTGGLVGGNYKGLNEPGVINDCFSTGSVNDDKYTDYYAEGGGLIGEKVSGVLSNSYWYDNPEDKISVAGGLFKCIGNLANNNLNQVGCYRINGESEKDASLWLVDSDEFARFGCDYKIIEFKELHNVLVKCLTEKEGIKYGTTKEGGGSLGYFKGSVSSREPFVKWDFDKVWIEVAKDYPTLRKIKDVTPPSLEKTCGELGGDICTLNEYCSGTWLIEAKEERCCSINCRLSTKVCNKNNIAEEGEICDGTDLRKENCVTQGYTLGDLKCISCKFDVSGCKGEVIEDCTINIDDCWLLADTNCKADCTCKTGYEPDLIGGCELKEENECMPLHGICRAPGTCESHGEVVDSSYSCSTTTNVCCVKTTTPIPGGEGVCGIGTEEFNNFDEFRIAVVLDIALCESGILSSPIEYEESKRAEWKCGSIECEATMISSEINGIGYNQEGNCKGDDETFDVVINDEYTGDEIMRRTVYCPVLLPVFTLTNIAAVLVIVGIFYLFMNKGKKKKRKL